MEKIDQNEVSSRPQHENYDELLDRMLALPVYVLIATGRTGSDFVHSLLDSHPEILLFNGVLKFHTFWAGSICVQAGNYDLSDLLDEFIGKNIEKFKTRYDLLERKDQLGENQDQHIDMDIALFKAAVINLLRDRSINSKNTMVAIYTAYAICRGEDLSKKKILFHHEHSLEVFDKYLKDFPESKVICMTRDPRANFVSGIENWRQFDSSKDRGLHLFYYVKRLMMDVGALDRFGCPVCVIRVEDLGDKTLLKSFAAWLGVSYQPCMEKSTWGGLLWHGDRLSQKQVQANGLCREILKNNWETRLSPLDKYILNYLLNERLKYYGYPYKEVGPLTALLVGLCILFPLRYELRYWSYGYIKSCLINRDFRKMISNFLCYIRRIILFYQYYVTTFKKRPFNPYTLKPERKI